MKQSLRQSRGIGDYGHTLNGDYSRRRFEQKEGAGKNVCAAAEATIVVRCPDGLRFRLRHRIQSHARAWFRRGERPRRADTCRGQIENHQHEKQ